MSIQDIRPNPQDTSNFYLANIYQTVADPNRSNISSSLPTSPPPFSPPNYAVWVNSLWFLSLVISLTCALLATLLQQWARRYLKVTHSRYSPHKRARIRAFFSEGVDKFLLPWAVETLPALLHISLFLFFAGLVVFLWNVDITIFKLVLSWVGVCTALYGCITFMPIFRLGSPYYTSLSSSVWLIVIGIRYVVFRVRWCQWSYLSVCCRRRRRHPTLFRIHRDRYHKLLLLGMQRTAEETALNSRRELDTRAFMWTFDSLDEDHELERFFSGLPGFRSSKVVEDPLPRLTKEQKGKLSETLIGFLDSTFSSDLLPAPVKKRRATICAKVIDPAHIPEAFDVLDMILSNDQDGGPLAAEILQIARGWRNNRDENTNLDVQAAVCSIVARVQQRDDSWFILASKELGVPESVLRDYATHGDSLSLAILIHITRHQFSHYWKPSWPRYGFSKVLEAASKFNIQDTSPELQHDFCTLWNQIVREAQNAYSLSMAWHVLRPIRNVYVALHQDTDSAPTRFSPSTNDLILSEPSSYPVCNVAGHIHDDSASTTFTRTVLHDNAALDLASHPSPDVPSSSVPALLHVDESITDVPSLDNFHPAHQTTTGSLRIPVTSPDSATAGAIPDIVTSGITMPSPTPETSTVAPPHSSTSLTAAVSLQHNPDLLTSSDQPNLPYSASSNPVLDNILPTGPPLSSHPSMTRSDLSPFFPESHRSTIVPTALSASPGPTSAPDLGAAAEDDGSPQPGLSKEKDALDPPSVNRAIHANTMATLDLSPQSPSLPLVNDSDVAIAGRSLREPNAERTGDHRPYPSHSP